MVFIVVVYSGGGGGGNVDENDEDNHGDDDDSGGGGFHLICYLNYQHNKTLGFCLTIKLIITCVFIYHWFPNVSRVNRTHSLHPT